MDGMMNIDPAPPRAQIVRRIESIFNTWAHVIDEGIDWQEALSRDYWARVVERFRPGDSVIIHSSDHLIQICMRVLDVNIASDPVYLLAAYQPIYPADLELPSPALQLPPRYVPRMAPGGGWRVIDTESGAPVHENIKNQHAAQEHAAELNRALAAAGEQIARGFMRQQSGTPAPRSKAAERTARWRSAKRAEAAGQPEGDAA
jgi:hypothetical protein